MTVSAAAGTISGPAAAFVAGPPRTSLNRLVLATRNAGKVRELGRMLAELEVEVLGLDAFGKLPEVVEDADTYLGNALKKAHAAALASGLPALADDSGLEVAALDGAPGLYSARYGGPCLDDAGRCDYLLRQLAERGVARSPGQFRAVVVLVRPDGEEHWREGVWSGEVHGPATGEHGFGYDPIFWLPGRPVTAAMLEAAEKDRLSHRAQALAAMMALLRERPELLR